MRAVRFPLILTTILAMAMSSTSFAGNKNLLVYSGRLVTPSGTPENSSSVIFTFQMLAPNGCVLWQETSSAVNMSGSSGAFTVYIGGGANSASGSLTWNQIFQNGIALGAGALSGTGCPGTYTGAGTDDRTLYVSFNDGSGSQSVGPIAVKATAQNANFAGYPVQLMGAAPNNGDVLSYDSVNKWWYPTAGGGGSGTVTSVTSTNSDISVATGTSTPALTLNTGTGNNQIVKLNGTAQLPAVSGANLTNLSATALTGIVPVANGGTGLNSSAAANGQLLIGNGAGFTLASLTAGSGVTITPAAGSITIAATGSLTPGLANTNVLQNTSGASLTTNNILVTNATGMSQLSSPASGVLTSSGSVPSWSTTLPATMGGTGTGAYTIGDILYASTTSALSKLAAGANAYVLTSNGPGVAPSWQAAAVSGITQLTGDVTAGPGSGSQAAAVAQVGGSSAVNVHNAEVLANAATSANTNNQIVKRDGSGNFSAGTITASLTGASSLNVLKAGDTMTGALAVNVTNASPSAAVAVTQSGTGYGATIMGGSVGIGTTAPASALQVAGNLTTGGTGTAAVVSNFIMNGDNAAGNGNLGNIQLVRNHYDTSGVAAQISFYREGGAVEGQIRFGTNPGPTASLTPTDRMTILANGNVGINTTTPASKLDVAGTVNFGTPGTVNGDLTMNHQLTVAHGTSGTSNVLVTSTAVTGAASIDLSNTGASGKDWQIVVGGNNVSGGGGTGAAEGNFQIKDVTDSLVPFFIAKTTGNVGIGTTAPGTTLDLNGALSERGISAPSVSPVGQGRIYFDSTSNQFMVSQNGSAYAPLGIAGSGVASFSGRTGAVSPAANDYSFSQISGTAATTQGGTGLTTYATGDMIYASAANTLSKLSAGTSNYVLTSGGPGVAPSWQAAAVTGITQLTGDVTAGPGTGSQSAAVALVGGSSAANVHSAEVLANAATNLNTASQIVKRDASGNFSAGTITASVTGASSLNVLKAGDTMTGTLNANPSSAVAGISVNQAYNADGIDVTSSAAGIPISVTDTGYTSAINVTGSTGSAVANALIAGLNIASTYQHSGTSGLGRGLNVAVTNNTGSSGSLYGANITATANTAGATAVGLSVTAASSGGTAYSALFNGGNVGIGTTTPSQKLEVAGIVKATDFQFADTGIMTKKFSFANTVTAGNIKPLASFTNDQGSISYMIQVQAKSSGQSGTKVYLFEGGYSQLTTSWYKMVPLETGRGHGDGTAGFDLYVRQGSAGWTYDFGVAANTSTKLLITTFTNIGTDDTARSPTPFVDISASAEVAQSSAGDVYSHRTAAFESNVGIGTASAAYPLSVFATLATDGVLANFNDSASNVALNIRSNTSIPGLAGKHIDFLGTSGTSDMSLSPSTSFKGALILKGNTGNVGVGSATPATKLDVNGAIRMGMDATACSAANAGAQRYNAGTMEYCAGTGPGWTAYGASGAGVTSVAAGSGLSGGGTGAVTVSLGTELLGLSGLSTNGFVKRTAAGTYSTPSIGLTTDVSGTLPVANGGTGIASFGANRMVMSGGTTTAPLTYDACTIGQVLQYNGSSWSCVTVSTLVGGTGFVQGGNSFGATGVIGTKDANDLSIIAGNAAAITVKNGGSVGIGTATPQAALDVYATGSTSALLVPRDTTANRPSSAVNGMIRYNSTIPQMEAYINNVWVPWGTAATGAGNTMITNYPDTIQCTAAGAHIFLRLDFFDVSTNQVNYLYNDMSTNYRLTYSNTGAYVSNTGGSLAAYDCVSSTMSISALYSAGRAYNLVNGSGASQWATTGSSIWYNAGNVGIGTNAPVAGMTLDVNGTTKTSASVEGVATDGNSTAAYTITTLDKNIRTVTLNANTTITLPNPATIPANTAYTLTLRLTQDGTGARTVTWAGASSTIKWDSNAAPTIASGASQSSIVQFTIFGGETVWYASMVWKEQ